MPSPFAQDAVPGRASVAAAGRVLTAAYSETFPKGLHRRNLQMAAAGCQLFMLIVRGGWQGEYGTSWFWRDEDLYGDESDRHDGLDLDAQARAILEVQPDAWFFVRWGSEVPGGWARRHPDELQAHAGGPRGREASYASRLALAGRCELARRVVQWCEARPWGRRVLGYMAFGQDEGTHNLAIEDCLFDQAPAMLREYRAYLQERYGSDAALREAWGDPQVTLATALLPTDSQWQAARQAWGHWPDPSATRPHRDYFEVYRRLLALQRTAELAAVAEAALRPVIKGTDALKQPMSGWLLQDAFDARAHGPAYRNILLASGSLSVAPILDHPALDCLITPADYTARSCGYGFEPEGIGDSLVLRGKTIFVEDDARSWATDEHLTQGAWRTPDECRAGLLRNLAVAASRGFFPYWMNVAGGYFDDPDVLRIVAEQIPVREQLLTRPRVETEHAICLLLDDSSPLEEDFTSGFQNLAVLRQRNDALALTGLPWRVHLFADLARDDFPRYRCYLLPNCFRLDDERRELIRQKLLRDGSVVVCGPGTGLNEGAQRGPQAFDLFGLPLERVDCQVARRVLAYGGAHPSLAGVSGPTSYGDSYTYGPLLQPAADLAKHDCVELGRASTWWRCNRAGLVLREHGLGAAANGRPGPRGPGDCAVVFSVAVPLPALLLRSLALYGGCVAWSHPGDVVAANDTMLAVHSCVAGPRQLHLPGPHRVTDAVSGEVLAASARALTIELSAPDTRVLLLD